MIFLDFCEEFFKKCLTNLLNDDNIVRLTCCKATQRRTLKTIQNKEKRKTKTVIPNEFCILERERRDEGKD